MKAKRQQRYGPADNKIDLPFGVALQKLLAAQPKKKQPKRKAALTNRTSRG